MARSEAVGAWSRLLGSDGVVEKRAEIEQYARDTSAFSQRVLAVLRPHDTALIPELLRIAGREMVPVYPVSTGKNWGYGTANPPHPDCAIVDLSRLRGIAFDEDLGLASVEPGVTQADLYEYLASRKLDFMVPVTGAGPRCSLLGNALERGFGLTPYGDHFGAVTALEAVLPNGEIYRRALAELGAGLADRAFKWGVGPYLDGLFSQGSFGIVTRMTIALARKPPQARIFFFSIDNSAQLEKCVTRLRDLTAACGATLGGINLMNRARLEAMTISEGTGGSPAELVGAKRVPAWTGVGVIYGTRGMVRAAQREVRRVLSRCDTSARFVDPYKLRFFDTLLCSTPPWFLSGFRRKIQSLLPAARLLTGEPCEGALRLAYARNKRLPTPGDMDPARDGCGLFWYSPIVPILPKAVQDLVTMVEDRMRAHGFEAPITLTSHSDRCFECTVPILFDRDRNDDASAAEKCYEDLFESGRKHGFVPYRLGAQFMHLAVRGDMQFWRLAAALKAAVDPAGILSPCRYGPPFPQRPWLAARGENQKTIKKTFSPEVV